MTAATTKERPILFSGPMVWAILDGRKSQTRRIVKGIPRGVARVVEMQNDFVFATPSKTGLSGLPNGATVEDCVNLRCPYGRPGDRLWVKEKFGPCAYPLGISNIADATYVCFPDGAQKFRRGEYCTWDKPVTGAYPDGWKWRPSIHMPRWASRITLEVTGVRVERMQDISEADAAAEGVDAISVADMPRNGCFNRRTDFMQIWNIINGPDSWTANPWVWVVEFKRVEGRS